ncbi:hypothetical protein GUITHDRAFT_53984, partial [Guillardia theta CCMP2712]
GKLNFVDLAGNEDGKKGGSQSKNLDTNCISHSLQSLGSVLHALNSHAAQIPYKETKITQLLQDSMNPSSSVMVMTCIAPHPKFYQDTHNSLCYANKAR